MGKQFSLVKILILRNVELMNEEYLQNLSILRYLDLKHTIVRTCKWLEGLVELQVLDLRYTNVTSIPDRYLEKMVKLQHLLSGYLPNDKAKRLVGASVNIGKLKTENLKTLRAAYVCTENGEVRDIDDRNVRNVDDLFVTGLTEKSLKRFWMVLNNFQNLTSLGVAMTKGSVTLRDWPKQLKEKLKRLQMEGQFFSGDFNELSVFQSLVDLTLAFREWGAPTIQINNQPSEKLLCLRLYGFYDAEVLEFGESLKKMKKLVIGDMRKVETIKIHSAVIKAVDTLKLCNLPKFLKLVCLDSERPILIRNGENSNFEDVMRIRPDKWMNIFLRGYYEHLPESSKGKGKASSSSRDIKFDISHGVKIYRYDKNKQCYESMN